MIITAEMDIDGEDWRPVVSRGVTFSRYLVSNYGRILGPRGKVSVGKKVGGGYLALDLTFTVEETKTYTQFTNTIRGERRVANLTMHGLVAETFMPIRDNLPPEWANVRWSLTQDHFNILQRLYMVDHINGDKHDNRVANLRYVTSYQNNSVVKKVQLNEYERNTEFGT